MVVPAVTVEVAVVDATGGNRIHLRQAETQVQAGLPIKRIQRCPVSLPVLAHRLSPSKVLSAEKRIVTPGSGLSLVCFQNIYISLNLANLCV